MNSKDKIKGWLDAILKEDEKRMSYYSLCLIELIRSELALMQSNEETVKDVPEEKTKVFKKPIQWAEEKNN